MAYKWFKFYPQTWITGRIMLESHDTKGAFIDCCNLLFTREGDIDLELLRGFIRNDPAIDRLIDRGFIKINDGLVVIDWINEEIQGASYRTQIAQEKAHKRWHGKATAMQRQSGGNAKRKENKTKENTFKKPSEKQVKMYFAENNKSEANAIEFYLYYESQGWIKSNNVAVKNWKATAQTWWKKENKNKPKYNIA